MAITIEELKELRNKVGIMFKELEKETGFKIELGKISYTENTFTGKIEGVKFAPGETDEDIERRKFAQDCMRFGFSAEDFGKHFNYRGITYKITGVNLKASKNTTVIQDIMTGRVYVMPHTEVKKAIDILPKEN